MGDPLRNLFRALKFQGTQPVNIMHLSDIKFSVTLVVKCIGPLSRLQKAHNKHIKTDTQFRVGIGSGSLFHSYSWQAELSLRVSKGTAQSLLL